ncbi:MAG: guanylate kinase [Rhodospirillales bacterium]|nr:guanylate kinase [Rhodospirillales bacterium]
MGTIARRGLCLVLAAPSGAGKSTIARELRAREAALMLSVSVTTRAPRPGECEGVDYYFRDQAAFDAMADQGGLLEWARVLGRDCYGTPRAPVEAALAAGQDMLFDIDWQGYRSLRAALPGDVVGVFLLPPSRAALAARLGARGADSAAEIARRMARAADEMAHAKEFDHVVVNDVLDEAVAEVAAILAAARTAQARLTGLAGFVSALAPTFSNETDI